MSSTRFDTRLYFVRHGESVSNVGGVTMAHADIPLTALPHAQAAAVAQRLPANPSQVWTSPYLRARETAVPYCQRIAREAGVCPILREFSAIDPALLAGMTGEQRRPIANAYWEAADPAVRMGAAAETFFEFNRRVRQFVGELPDIPGESVLFGHGVWIGLLCWQLEGRDVANSEDMKAFRRFQMTLRMPNCGVYVLRGSPSGSWTLVAH